MLNVYVRGGARPAGGIPHPTPDGESATLWVFYAYAPDSPHLAIVNDAIELIRERVAAPGVMDTCNAAFRDIRNVSFQDLFTGAHPVTVYKHPTAATADEFALTQGDSGLARHITLTRNCWGLSSRGAAVERTAATLVHEMAHCAGAGGDSTVAERTLMVCGFQDHFDASVRG